jgi:hypothetical protein
MPRKSRFCPAGYPIHVIQRGNNRQAIFTCDADMAAYSHWLSEGAKRFGVCIHGWVLMTNHVHLLATPALENPGNYRWSSYPAHAFGVAASMWSPHVVYLDLGTNGPQRQSAWRDLISEAPDIEVLAKIRHCANTGLVLGTESFRHQVHKLRT